MRFEPIGDHKREALSSQNRHARRLCDGHPRRHDGKRMNRCSFGKYAAGTGFALLNLLWASLPLNGNIGIRVDGDFTDWHERPHLLYLDPEGDNPPGGLDFTALGAYVSAQGLALYIQTAEPFRLATSQIRISLDTDGDASTGRAFLGLGVELDLDFRPAPGDLRFFPAQAVYTNGPTLPIAEVVTDILPNGLNDAMTHPKSREYEILLPLSMLPGVTPGGRIGIHLRDGNTGDFLPDIGENFFVSVPENLLVENTFYTLNRRDPDDIRFAVYNVYFEGPWRNNNRELPSGQEDRFIRQLVATQPDIIAFQEMWSTQPSTVRSFLNEHLPLETGSWHVVKNRTGSQDCITASRFPIIHTWDHTNRFTVALLDTREAFGAYALVVNAHTRAHQENQSTRLLETDNFMLLARSILMGEDAFSPEGEIALFVVGDLNANAPKPELTAARTGRFNQPARQTLNFWPDRFGLPLVDAAPRHTHRRSLATWKSITTSNTQRLDYILYPQSFVTLTRAFTIDTTTMPTSFRLSYGLGAADSEASDHLLLVADFRKRRISFAWEAEDVTEGNRLYSRWFGPLYIMGQNWFYSDVHGFVWAHANEGGVWIHDPELGWWYTHANLYPFAYENSTGEWIFFDTLPGNGKERAFFRFKEGRWRQRP